ncbi:hypothetical protein T05_4554 [Trichinella murrelli]|uniref:Uncharacterized protein n=1 Tax=Trichinella murrelli TaxID=144512 RepID=A0A0V0T9N1_9BILA|nr:hypothetical protein T05_8420 [Trichinella murrelli]KRX35658.1 hypothetical protein T05_4554 [Trichinella murrelli]
MLPFVMLAYNSSFHENREPAWARIPGSTGLHPRDLRAHRPCARPCEGPPEDAATSPKVPARPTRQAVTLLPERPRVAGDATGCSHLVPHMFPFGPTVHLLVVDHAILLGRQVFVVLVFLV